MTDHHEAMREADDGNRHAADLVTRGENDFADWEMLATWEPDDAPLSAGAGCAMTPTQQLGEVIAITGAQIATPMIFGGTAGSGQTAAGAALRLTDIEEAAKLIAHVEIPPAQIDVTTDELNLAKRIVPRGEISDVDLAAVELIVKDSLDTDAALRAEHDAKIEAAVNTPLGQAYLALRAATSDKARARARARIRRATRHQLVRSMRANNQTFHRRPRIARAIAQQIVKGTQL